MHAIAMVHKMQRLALSSSSMTIPTATITTATAVIPEEEVEITGTAVDQEDDVIELDSALPSSPTVTVNSSPEAAAEPPSDCLPPVTADETDETDAAADSMDVSSGSV